jgi:rhomboid protease GluP
MFRRLIDDFREFPATMSLCTLWVLVFALMVLDQIAQGSVPTLGKLVLGIQGGRPFGELTVHDFLLGEVWLPLTATFVHYGLLHIGLNLFMMYQLGALIESWYGPWQFLAVYVVIGYGGNLLSALVRLALGSDPMIASGGGSVVVLGLAALCAVVGWRSRTRIGDSLRSQMVGLLIATAVLGLIVPIIDNWGHAGGALIGALIGFAHRTLIRTGQRPLAKWAGVGGLILLVASGAAQVRADRIEMAQRQRMARWEARIATAQRSTLAAQQETRTLEQIWAFYQIAVLRSDFEHAPFIHKSLLRRPEAEVESQAKTEAKGKPGARSRMLLPSELSEESINAALKQSLKQLESLRATLGTGSTAEDYRQIHILLENVLRRPPSASKNRAFQYHVTALFRRAQENQEAARARLESLLQQARAAESTPTRGEVPTPSGA